MGVEHAGEGVNVCDSAAHRTDTDAAGQASVSIRYVAGGLLVAGVDQPKAHPRGGSEKGIESVSAQNRHKRHAARLKLSNQ
jgi:hypothetical protein